MMRACWVVLSVTLLAACHDRAPADPVVLDGSSTAFPLAEAVAHEFMKANKATPVNVAFSGTGTGFVKFCRGQLDIANASRPITVEEQQACESANVSFVELPVAHDAITIVVNAGNTWASSITVPELRTLWDVAAEAKITTWKQIRADWPDRKITLFGPGAESGTFDYFTDSINGRAGVSRKDYTTSADDEVIVERRCRRRTRPRLRRPRVFRAASPAAEGARRRRSRRPRRAWAGRTQRGERRPRNLSPARPSPLHLRQYETHRASGGQSVRALLRPQGARARRRRRLGPDDGDGLHSRRATLGEDGDRHDVQSTQRRRTRRRVPPHAVGCLPTSQAHRNGLAPVTAPDGRWMFLSIQTPAALGPH